MIYAQITNRCNMTCAHCCFSCGLDGEDMPEETFHKCLDLSVKCAVPFCLGGGEPTMHPQFLDFLLQSISAKRQGEPRAEGSSNVSLTTNGSDTKMTLALAKLARHGFVSVRLSTDNYHDTVAPEVYKAFEGASSFGFWTSSDLRMVTNSLTNRDSGNVIPAGRAKNLPYDKVAGRVHDCLCNAIFVNPSGDAYPCGCRKTIIGNVHNMTSIDPKYLRGFCERSLTM